MIPLLRTTTIKKNDWFFSVCHVYVPNLILDALTRGPTFKTADALSPSFPPGMKARSLSATRFSAPAGSLFFQQIELKTKTNPNDA